ncbi:hypothetical protein L0F63_006588 [Massospora cicadina]|nr:hypothetical protein L0F63_006588 [Massospora cicadina]
MSQVNPSEGSRATQEKFRTIESQLFHRILGEFLSVGNHGRLETLPTVLNLVTTYRLVNWCFENSEGPVNGGSKLGQVWCQKLRTLLVPPAGGVSTIYAANLITACKLILESVTQSQPAFMAGVQDWSIELLRCLSRQNLGPEAITNVIEALSLLIRMTLDRPELQREITINVLPQFNSKLVEYLERSLEIPKVITSNLTKPGFNLVILKVHLIEAIRDSLRVFPKSFRCLAVKLRRALLSSWLSVGTKGFLLQSAQPLLAHLVFECLVLLSSTERSSAAVSEAFGHHFQALVATAHALLNRLLVPIQEELYPETTPNYPIEVGDSEAEAPSMPTNQLLLRRFCLACHAIFSTPATRSESPFDPIDELMNVLCRVYSVNATGSVCSKTFASHQTEASLDLLYILPTLHAAAHDVLIVLCRRVGAGGLSEKSKLLSDIVQKLLRFSQPHSVLRDSAYHLIYHMSDALGDSLLYHAQDAILAAALEELEIKELATPATNQLLGAGSTKGKRPGLTNSDALINRSWKLNPSKNYRSWDFASISSYPIDPEIRLRMDILLFKHSARCMSGELKLSSEQQLAMSKALLAAGLNASPAQAVLVEVSQAVFASALLHPCPQVPHALTWLT